MNNTYKHNENNYEDRSHKYLLFTLFLRSVSLCFPAIMIGFKYDFPLSFLVSTVVFLPAFIPFATFISLFDILYNLVLRPGLYVWALVVTIQGKQDFIAIVFYVITAIQAFNIIKHFLGYIFAIIESTKNR